MFRAKIKGEICGEKVLRATIVVFIIGVLGLDQKGKLIGNVAFPKDAVKIAEKLIETESDKIITEMKVLVKKLAKGGWDEFVFESPELARKAKREFEVAAEAEPISKISQDARENLGQLAVETGFVKDPSEITQWIHNVSMEISRMRVKKATEKRDLLVVQATQAVDDIDKTLNLFMARIREWYGLHFPEMDRLLENHETYARLVSNLGTKENFIVESLEKEGLPKNKAQQIADIAKGSMGASFSEVDMGQIQSMCKNVLQLYEARAKLEKYIDDLMAEVAPNTRALIGSALGGKLISIAGGLTNLAKRPASTIQVLGAEKALFRSLTTGAKPPKHGIIFQHTLIHGSKRWLRGKITRALAGKLAIALRTDAFSGNFIGDKLKADLQKRIEEIEKKYPEPKVKPREEKYGKQKKQFREARQFERRKKYGRRG